MSVPTRKPARMSIELVDTVESSANHRQKLLLAGESILLFVIVYFGTNWLAGKSGGTRVTGFDWERNVPLWPWFIYPYLSIFVVSFLPLFLLKMETLVRLSRQLNTAILVSGIIFLLWPTSPPFERAYQENFQLLHMLRLLDLPHNALPSLHISISFLCYGALIRIAGNFWTALLRLWMALIVLSVWFVHQHTIPDIAAGLCIALVIRQLAPLDT